MRIRNMPNAEYQADNSISRSMIMQYLDSPYKYWGNFVSENRVLREDMSDAMKFGAAFHCLMLEPELFFKQFAIKPEQVLLKDVGREKYDAYKAEVEEIKKLNKLVITHDEYEKLLCMKDRLHSHDGVSTLMQDCDYEVSYFWLDEHTEFRCRARPDIEGENHIVDIKTIANSSAKSFTYAVIEGGYHIQAAMMRDAVRAYSGKDITKFWFICIEKTYPYSVGLYLLDEAALEEGQQEYKQALLDIKACISDDYWPDREPQIITLPNWRKK